MFGSLYLFLILFPFLVIPLYGSVTAFKMGVFVYVCLAFWIYFLLKSSKQKGLLTEKAFYVPEVFLLLLAIWAGISAILSSHPYVSLFGTVTRFEGILSLYCYFSVFFIASRFAKLEKYSYYITGFVCLSMVSGLLGMLQKLFPLLPFIHGDNRVDSFFGNPDFYGSYLVIMLFLAIILLLAAKGRGKSILFFCIANLLFLNVLFSGTRSALVGVFAGLLLFSLLFWGKFQLLRKRYTWLLVCFILLFGIVNLFESNSYLQRLLSIMFDAKQIFQNNNDSGFAGTGRWKLWEIALPLVFKHPFFGSGPDTIRYVFDQAAFRTFTHISNLTVDKAHNEYLQIAITMGIPALLFYMLFLGSILQRIWKAVWKCSGEKQLLLSGLFALLIAYMVQAFFNISVVPVAPFFWLMLGMAYRLARTTASANSEQAG